MASLLHSTMQNPTLNPQHILFNPEIPEAQATMDDQKLYLRVHRSCLEQIPTTASKQPPSGVQQTPFVSSPPTNTPSGHLYLIAGEMKNIQRYAGRTVDWVITVSHLICARFQSGRLYTHTSGTVHDWYHKDREADWREVMRGDELHPGIYEFDMGAPIGLSQLCEHEIHSLTSLNSQSDSTAFRKRLDARDRVCVVTGMRASLTASHLVPKRLGLDGVKLVMNEFVGHHEALEVDMFHPMIGILLWGPLYRRVDQYNLGFHHKGGKTYILHNFGPDCTENVTVVGGVTETLDLSSIPLLHGFEVTLRVHGGDERPPPKGIFDWHYLQCVAKKFGTKDYWNHPGVRFHVHPFKTADDLDDDFSENDNPDAEPPYPTYYFDNFMAEQRRLQAIQNRSKEVAMWSAGVLPDAA